MLTLNDTLLRRLEAVQHAFFDLAGATSLEGWRARLCRAVQALCDADVVRLTLTDLAPVAQTRSDRAARSRTEARRARMRVAEPAGTEVYGPTEADVLADLCPEPVPHLPHAAAVRAPHPAGEGVLYLAFDAIERAEAALPLLRLLMPSFGAALALYARLDAHRRTLDALDEPLAVLDVRGGVLFRSAAFERLVPTLARPALLDEALASTTLRLLHQAEDVPSCRRTVTTPDGAFGLHAVRMAEGTFGPGSRVLVTVAPPRSPLPPAEALQTRFGLTSREAEVALLLAQGLANDALAERLYISPHTARRHTERVLEKLEVHSRAAVLARLLEP